MKALAYTLTTVSISLQDIFGINDRAVRCKEFQIAAGSSNKVLLSYDNVHFVELAPGTLFPRILPCQSLARIWLKTDASTQLIHLIVGV